uniref:Uncharacterized protein n=1 Tax=Rhizophagus irregularis (strain DAOM 181602 / DAOM 197198 / MUCL 43194) TaxID=747089 RepID=U9TRD5_RHIID
MERLSVEDDSNRIKEVEQIREYEGQIRNKEAEDESIRGVNIEQQKNARLKKNNRGGKGKSRAKYHWDIEFRNVNDIKYDMNMICDNPICNLFLTISAKNWLDIGIADH